MSKPRPIRVAFFEPYPMGLGGNFLTQRLLLERLDRCRFHPTVVSPVDGAALDRYRAMGVECAVIAAPASLGAYGGALLRIGFLDKLRSAVALARYNLRLARFLKDREIDIVYANSVRAQLSVGLAARLVQVPSLLYIKGELTNPLIDHLSFLLADRIAFQSEVNARARYRATLRSLHRKIEIIKPGIDPDEIQRAEATDHSGLRRELGIDGTCLNTVVVGQVSALKGVHCVVEALAALAAEFPRLRLFIVGDCVLAEHEPYKRDIVELVDELGLGDRIRFLGWRSDALDILACMSIVVQPSLTEGFSGVVLESMALARPLVATAVGGHREVIRDGVNGFLVAPGDVAALTRRWRELLLRPQLRARLGSEARRTIFTDYMIQDNVDRFSRICAQLARPRRSAGLEAAACR